MRRRRGRESRTEMYGPGSKRTMAVIRTEQLLLLQRSLREGRQNPIHAFTSREASKSPVKRAHSL